MKYQYFSVHRHGHFSFILNVDFENSASVLVSDPLPKGIFIASLMWTCVSRWHFLIGILAWKSFGMDLDSLPFHDNGKWTHAFTENADWEQLYNSYLGRERGVLPSDTSQGLSGLCAEAAAGHRQGSCWAKTEPQPNLLGTVHWLLSVKLLGLPLFYIFYQHLPSSNLLRRYVPNVKSTTRLLYCGVSYPPRLRLWG